MDANVRLAVDLGLPDDIAPCASDAYGFSKITLEDQNTLVGIFENTTTDGLSYVDSFNHTLNNEPNELPLFQGYTDNEETYGNDIPLEIKSVAIIY